MAWLSMRIRRDGVEVSQMGSFAHTATQHAAPSCRFLLAGWGVGTAQGSSAPVVGPARTARTAAAIAYRDRQQILLPTMRNNQGVRVDVCPGHRSWSPPV
jgi:hypothetical protein